MASTSLNLKFDPNAWAAELADQFRGLNPNEPGQWPWLPKLAAFVGVTVLVLVLGWVFALSDEQAHLDAEVAKEPGLRQDYTAKLAQAVNLPELRKQKSQVEEYVTQLEKQLPGKAEMDALLSDINQAGVGRGLQFELFRPGQVLVKDYYAEQPISLRVSGRYHDIGAFAADVSNLSRIVTLHNLNVLAPTGKEAGSGTLSMEATARTYRYLDTLEVAEQKKLAAKTAGGAKK
ncbi:type 4a pilus biogenesis protein PilO [Paucibacter sp. DJ2R-2]|uniref:type 4a pilus biogenesis protein PilO n=1 Tax=Paucibacter sp. DJ2R-2 TaxID=2893558 RepID=UPI0021E3B8EB|nr:type 4a pilus biogenesis protein PilO [Paucibacter sp. DJ2R-2]MCV2421902.1 type 4a pilus biogenesis protein PilO [Paucibacter sp. DJ4R-1]MCV2439481.1 type 4a pilus biogenesis protein PilO [Paucibacter sp. DJ2R-2]